MQKFKKTKPLAELFSTAMIMFVPAICFGTFFGTDVFYGEKAKIL
jgi:hypothetical protein